MNFGNTFCAINIVIKPPICSVYFCLDSCINPRRIKRFSVVFALCDPLNATGFQFPTP